MFSSMLGDMAMIIHAGHLCLEIDPEKGGKVTGITDERLGRNFCAADTPDARLPLPDGAVFSMYGWDEAFPTIEPDDEAPTLGEAWRQPADCQVVGADMVSTWDVSGWIFQRVITMQAQGFTADYNITNQTDKHSRVLWAAHPLFTLEKLVQVDLPGGNIVPGPGTDMADARQRLVCAETGWMIAEFTSCRQSWKFFLPSTAPVVLRYQDAELILTTTAPWWGIWLNLGIFGTRCLGVEATNAPTDYRTDVTETIPAGCTFRASWTLQVHSHTDGGE